MATATPRKTRTKAPPIDATPTVAAAVAAAEAVAHAAPHTVTPPHGDGEVPIDWVVPSPFNPRKHFDQAALDELAASLKAHGMLQPIVVRELTGQGRATYEILAGERRYRAAQQAGLTFVPVRTVYNVDDRKALEICVIENHQRADLDPIEEAEGFAALRDLGGMSQPEIAAAVKSSQSRISRSLGLLKLPADVQDLLRTGALTMAHVETLQRFAPFPPVVSAIAALAAENHTTSRFLAQRPLYNAWELRQKGVIRNIYSADFDRNVCDACPFGAKFDDQCLNPAHFDELAAAARKERERETNRTIQAAKREGKSIPKLSDLPHDKHHRFYGARPAGCTTDCPCAGQALDNSGSLVAICTNPARVRKLEAAAQKIQRDARNARLTPRREALRERLAGLDTPAARDLAPITASVLKLCDLKTLRPIAAAYAPTLDLSSKDSLQFQNRQQLWDALLIVEPLDQIRLMLGVMMSQDINNASTYEHGNPTLADWYLHYQPPAVTSEDLAAIATPADEDLAEQTCCLCGDTFYVDGDVQRLPNGDPLCPECEEAHAPGQSDQ